MKPQVLIGAVNSGSGKTTLTIGLLRALKKRGLQVQPFKCGPDYIDTQYHAIAADRDSINLDAWMASRQHVQFVYNRYAENADVCVTEGVMGLFDGYKRMQGSSAEMARLLNIPVVLVVNARATAYSVAPVLYGFKHFRPAPKIVGVIFNQVSSPAHYVCLKEACVEAGLESLGYLPAEESFRLPSRHLGLTLVAKKAMDELAERIACEVERHIDINKLLDLCTRPFPCAYSLPYTQDVPVDTVRRRFPKMQIAVARDPAFSFIYRENLDRLREMGGCLTFFSPLYSKELPKADLIYLPGGYPELFSRQLHRRKLLMKQLYDYVETGGKVLAECGGMMLLARSLTTQKGTVYEMAGALPLACTMEDAHLHLGYRCTEYRGMVLKGHEFHYSSVVSPESLPSVAALYNAKGNKVATPLYRYKNVVAGYTHWYWGETDLFRLWE